MRRAALAEAMLGAGLAGCRSCIAIQMQPALPGERGAASVPTDSFTCLEVESAPYLAGSAGLINLFNNDAELLSGPCCFASQRVMIF